MSDESSKKFCSILTFFPVDSLKHVYSTFMYPKGSLPWLVLSHNTSAEEFVHSTVKFKASIRSSSRV